MQLRLTVLAAAACFALFQSAITLSQTNRVNLGIDALVTGASTEQATNPPYLAQFPSPERIKADVSGVDAMETAAKHASIFWQLRELIYNLALSQRRTDRQFTPDERRLEVEYRNARYRAVEPFGEPDYRNQKWFEVYTKYENDLWLRDEVFKKYFTPELRRQIYVALKGQIPTQNAPEQSRLTPPAGSSTAGANPPRTSNNTSEAVQVGPKTTTDARTTQSSAPDANNVEAYLAEGNKYRDAKEYAKAVELYRKANAIQASAVGYNELGTAYKNLKQYPEAVAAYKQAIQLKPNDAVLHSNLGNTYAFMEQYENAIGSVREAIRLNPNYAFAYDVLGLAHSRLEQYAEALSADQQAVRLEPDNAAYLLSLGMTYVDMRREVEARQISAKLLTLNKSKAAELEDNISFFLANASLQPIVETANEYLDKEQYYFALQAFHHALALKSELTQELSAVLHFGRGMAYVGLKRYAKAAAEFRESIRLDPKDPTGHLFLGKTYLAMGDKLHAQQTYRVLLSLDKEKARELYAEINK